MKYSAGDLVKRSAAQLVFLREKLESILTARMLKGEKFQSKVVKDESLSNVVADEMRGCYAYNDIEIFFCIDMIKNGNFYEIKSVFDKNGNDSLEYDDWYLNSSLLQCAFYKSLLLKMEGNKLYTPKFRIKEGYKKISIEINKNNPYYLIFGKIGIWEIKVINPDEIINFYKDKISHLKYMEDAKIFDLKFKHKEFELLNPYFQYNKL